MHLQQISAFQNRPTIAENFSKFSNFSIFENSLSDTLEPTIALGVVVESQNRASSESVQKPEMRMAHRGSLTRRKAEQATENHKPVVAMAVGKARGCVGDAGKQRRLWEAAAVVWPTAIIAGNDLGFNSVV
ncbi:hypothetical protein U1Q18_021865 [Sarracenia purpurea var. burkii]